LILYVVLLDGNKYHYVFSYTQSVFGSVQVSAPYNAMLLI